MKLKQLEQIKLRFNAWRTERQERKELMRHAEQALLQHLEAKIKGMMPDTCKTCYLLVGILDNKTYKTFGTCRSCTQHIEKLIAEVPKYRDTTVSEFVDAWVVMDELTVEEQEIVKV